MSRGYLPSRASHQTMHDERRDHTTCVGMVMGKMCDDFVATVHTTYSLQKICNIPTLQRTVSFTATSSNPPNWETMPPSAPPHLAANTTTMAVAPVGVRFAFLLQESEVHAMPIISSWDGSRGHVDLACCGCGIILTTWLYVCTFAMEFDIFISSPAIYLVRHDWMAILAT